MIIDFDRDYMPRHLLQQTKENAKVAKRTLQMLKEKMNSFSEYLNGNLDKKTLEII